jgi:hypothetical protein
VYFQSDEGKAMTGSCVSWFFNVLKLVIASFGSKPPLYPESLNVSLNKGATMMAKSLMCVGKKFHRLTNDLIVFTSRFDSFHTKSESDVGDFFVSKKTVVKVDFEMILFEVCHNLF